MKVTLRKKKLSNGDNSLYLEYYENGKRSYEFLKMHLTKDKEQNKKYLKLANDIRDKRQYEMQNYSYGFLPDFRKKTNFVTYFEQLKERKPKYLENYHSTLKHLKDFTKGHIEIANIDEKWLEAIKEYFLTKVSQNSASSYFTLIKSALNEAVKEKLIITNPSKTVQGIKMIASKREYLLKEEIEALAKTECIIPDLKRAFLFSCFTGLRFSDVKKLTWQEIKGDRLEISIQKTKEFDYLPLSQTAKNILFSKETNIYPLSTNLVFDIPKRSHSNVIIKKWCKDAGIDKHISFHCARHTYATLCLTQGTDLYTVSKLLSHRNIKTTQIYGKIIDETKQKAVNSLPVIEVI